MLHTFLKHITKIPLCVFSNYFLRITYFVNDQECRIRKDWQRTSSYIVWYIGDILYDAWWGSILQVNQNMSILLIGGLENSKACEQFT